MTCLWQIWTVLRNYISAPHSCSSTFSFGILSKFFVLGIAESEHAYFSTFGFHYWLQWKQTCVSFGVWLQYVYRGTLKIFSACLITEIKGKLGFTEKYSSYTYNFAKNNILFRMVIISIDFRKVTVWFRLSCYVEASVFLFKTLHFTKLCLTPCRRECTKSDRQTSAWLKC